MAANHPGTIVPYRSRRIQSQPVLEGIVVDPTEIQRQPLLDLEGLDIIARLCRDKRSADTRRAYEGDLKHFHLSTRGTSGPFCREDWVADISDFISWPPPKIALRLTHYRGNMIETGLAEATINRRLAAVRSLLQFSFRLGLSRTDGRNLVDSEKVRSYRDTRGIEPDLVKKLFLQPALKYGGELAAIRDEAMLRLMAQRGLRRVEVHRLDVGDFSHVRRTINVRGKGRGTQKETITIAQTCADAVAAYLMQSGHGNDLHGPLFRNLDHRPEHAGNRLTTRAVNYIVAAYGAMIGVDGLRPHQLRHTAGTQLSKKSNGNHPLVQEFMRHSDANTTAIYIHNAQGTEKKAGDLLAEVYD